jgi:hypothetical protein
MEQQILELLQATQLGAAQPRLAAEVQLKQLYNNEGYSSALVTIATHRDVAVKDRLAALISLKSFVNSAWSPSLEDFAGEILVSDPVKNTIREQLLSIVYDGEADSKITSNTAAVVAVIAKSDFPEQWPGLLDSLLHKALASTDDQIQAILVVLSELIQTSLDEDQFYHYATGLINCLHQVSTDGARKLLVRAHAVSIFRSSFDFVENLKDKDEESIRTFAKTVCDAWAPFFMDVVKEPMPEFPSKEEEENSVSGNIATQWRGVVALKIQVILTLAKIQNIFPDLMAASDFFNACWDAMQAHATPYYASYVDGERQGGLINQYQLPYTLDFLVIEEIDYLQILLEAPSVRQQLDAMLAADNSSNGTSVNNWITQVLSALVTYSSITNEAEEMWDIDYNVFLSEETFAETNNSPRSVCAGFVWKICGWFPKQTLESLIGYVKAVFDNANSG